MWKGTSQTSATDAVNIVVSSLAILAASYPFEHIREAMTGQDDGKANGKIAAKL